MSIEINREDMIMIKAAIMGYGTIGSGTAEILESNRDRIAAQAGQEIQLKYVLDCGIFLTVQWQIRSFTISRLSRRMRR